MLCRTEIREPDAGKTASAPAVERPGAGRSDCVCGAVANLPRRVGNCARNAAGKDGPPPEPAPPDAGPRASNACAIPRPARPSTGAPGSVPRNASRSDCAPSAASITTSRTGGCAGPAEKNAGPPCASDTAAPGEPVSNTVASESAPAAVRDASAAASGDRPARSPDFVSGAVAMPPSRAAPVASRVSKNAGSWIANSTDPVARPAAADVAGCPPLRARRSAVPAR